MKPAFTPQRGDRNLMPHAHRMTLGGSPSTLTFPPLCPNCGKPATRRIRCTKVFYSFGSHTTNYELSSADVPFCDACIARHEAQDLAPTSGSNLLARVISAGSLIPVLVVGALALAGAHVAGLTTADDGGVRLFLVLLGLPAGMGALLHARGVARRARVPPQSSVTEAFDFSDDVREGFEPHRFVCTIRDGGFAQAFAALNRERLWQADSPKAQAQRRSSNRKFLLLVAVIAVFVLTLFAIPRH